MNKVIKEKIKEAFQSVVPVALVILILSLIFKLSKKEITDFIVGGVFLIVGLGFFNLGAATSMMKISEEIGRYVTKKQNLLFLIFITFIIGFIITISEPSIWVLSDQFLAIPPTFFIFAISLGVAVFLVFAILRIVFQIPLRIILLTGYLVVFILVILIQIIEPTFIPVAFDAGGATTGPLAVPFIVALGLGIARTRGEVDEDSFGLVGIASIGPIISVLILGLIWDSNYQSTEETVSLFGYLIRYTIQVGLAILPFIIFFIIFQVFAIKLTMKKVIRIIIGFIITYIGLVLYLTGANAGLISIGLNLGKTIASIDFNWILIPFGMIFGFLIVAAEPSVIVLNKQVEDVTGGAISRKLMMYSMAIGVSIASGLSLVRVLFGLNILLILIPGYCVALILPFFVPKVFTAIAYDSGGAVSGAMTSTFLMPFVLGASIYIPTSNPLLEAFGLIAFIALSPLITIQILGLIYRITQKKRHHKITEIKAEENIIDLQEVAK